MESFIICTIKPWNIERAHALCDSLKNTWHSKVIVSPEELGEEILQEINPRYVFFPHWSWIIPEKIWKKWECVIFHLGNVPFGRGGSPLQNHIVRGIEHTKVSALRAVAEIDAGPVYTKRDISLYGSAEEIFLRLSQITFTEIIPWILQHSPSPVPQIGEGDFYPRRKPQESCANSLQSLETLYDWIRMLDAEGYPRAFMDIGAFRLSFSRAQKKWGRVSADVTITMREEEKDVR